MKKYIVFLICLSSLLSLCSINICALSAHSAIVMEAQSNSAVFEKNSHERMPMASTTKIMTALVALENSPVDNLITVSDKAVGVEGSSLCLKSGEQLTLEELLYAMLLESANDAAAAIAIGIGGSIEAFADMMNQKAAELGLKDTSFENPHGLDGENHYTTAYDLAVIAAEAMKNEKFSQIVSTYRYRIGSADSGYRYLLNHNKMLKLYDGAIGVKTGFTKKSGRCLVSCAERNGMKFIAVTLNAPDDWNDHTEMLDTAFACHERVTLVAHNEINMQLSCIGGSTGEITVQNTNEISATLPIGKYDITKTVYMPRFLYAPIKADEVVGKVVVRSGEMIIGESNIVTKNESVAIKEKTPFWKLF